MFYGFVLFRSSCSAASSRSRLVEEAAETAADTTAMVALSLFLHSCESDAEAMHASRDLFFTSEGFEFDIFLDAPHVIFIHVCLRRSL